MPIRRPRTRRNAAGPIAVTSAPSNTMRPAVRTNARGCNPSTDSAVSDLPLPVSPTTAVMLPAGMSNDTSCSTGTSRPSGARNAPP